LSGRLFRTGLFGYKKSDVVGYIEKVSKDFTEKLDAKEKEIDSLKKELDSIKQKADELSGAAEEYEVAKASISNAIIKAEKNADLIIEEAKRSSLEEKLKVKREIQEETARLRRLKHEVADLRRDIVSSIKRFNSELAVLEEEQKEPSD
jgi:cell division septum initiation protein DivIVA